jgi:hypothetical protein
MSVEGELFGPYIDMNRDETVHALMALDTELNQLHRLCLEQGPFFKALFEEVCSDAQRQGLKQKLPRQPENQSHFERGYWKPAISHGQIKAIYQTVDAFSAEWDAFYEEHQSERFKPEANLHTASPVSLLDDEIRSLAGNIMKICKYLTSDTDTEVVETSDKVDVDPRKKEMQLFSQDLYKHLNACIYWIELTYDDTTKQAEAKKTFDNLMTALFGGPGPVYGFFGAMMKEVHLNKENLDLIIIFKGFMQTTITKQTKENTAMRREGIKLMDKLEDMIVKFSDVLAPPPVQSTEATLSNLLTRLTQMGNCST